MNIKTRLKLITIFIPITLLILYVLKDYILFFLPYVPLCPFYAHFHLYCPACGNTRSVLSLMNGDIASSLRYNVVPFFLALLSLLGYIELATYSFGTHIRLLPRKFSFYMTLIGILLVYMVVRNFIPYLTP